MHAQASSGAAALVGLVLLAYAPAVLNRYIWDDDSYVTANPTLRTWSGLGDIWLNPRATPQYYPLVHTTYWLEYRLWGLRPAGYHAVNIGLHALTSVVLWRILTLLGVPGAWLGAAIFAVHPVGVESVAWVTERKNTLSGLFAAVAVWQWLRWRFAPAADDAPAACGPSSAARLMPYGLATAAFVAAMLSKTVSITLVGVLPVIAWWKRGRLERTDLVAMLPWLAVGLPLALLTVWMEKTHVGAVGEAFALSPAERILVAGRAICFYAGTLLWPHPLLFFYERWRLDTSALWQWAYPAAVMAVAVALWLSRHRIGRGPITVLLLFTGMLFPALGFFDVYPFQFSFVADHFQYHASAALLAGIAAAAAWAATAIKLPRVVAVGAAGILLVLLGGLTFRQSRLYEDSGPLLRHVLAHNPYCYAALNIVGNRAYNEDDLRTAEPLFLRAVAKALPGEQRSRALCCLAQLRLREDRPREALAIARQAVAELRWPPAIGVCLLAIVRSGELDAADQLLVGATSKERSHVHARQAAAELALLRGRTADAAEAFRSLQRDAPAVALEVAVAYALAGMDDEAERQLSALVADPAFAVRALVNLGILQARRGDFATAENFFTRALQRDPENAVARQSIAKLRTFPKEAPPALHSLQKNHEPDG